MTPTGGAATIRYTRFQKALLSWVDLLGVATVDQLGLVLARKTAGETNYLYRILRKMFDLGLLAKEASIGRDVYSLPQRKVENVAHAVGVSEVMVRFALAFRAEGIEVTWIKEPEVVNGVLPDAWAVGEKPNVLAPRLFCFEFQRSKRSLAGMKRKLAAYEKAESLFRRDYRVGGVYRFFILSERQDAFSQATIRQLGRSAHDYAFVASDRQFRNTDPEKLLTVPMWWQAYEKAQVPVFVRRRPA